MERLKGNDLRIINSRQRITDAFLLLIADKSFRKITVKEIIFTADVNRSTFYHHFEDKWDLRDQYVKNTISCLMAAFKNIDYKVPINIETICEFTKISVLESYEHVNTYRTLFNPNLEIDVQQEISGIYYTMMMDWISHQPIEFKPQYPSELFAEIYAASAVATIKQAFKNNDKNISAEIEAEKTMQMIRKHLEKGFFRSFIEE